MTKAGEYVTDTDYIAGYYYDHAPAHLSAVAVFNGMPAPDPKQPFAWADFGCGHGVPAVALAAAHPHGSFLGIDVNPAFTAAATDLAARSEVQNVAFRTASFTELEPDDIPLLDYAVVHGIMSWVAPEVAARALDLATGALKPGGVLLVTYNALPGWSALLPLRDMIVAQTAKVPGTAADKARAGVAWLRAMRDGGAKFFQDHPAAAALLDMWVTTDERYLAHEYLNGQLRAYHHAEMSQALAERGMTFAGLSTLFMNMLELVVPPDLLPLFDHVGSRAELEAKRDFARNEKFRRDVYVKGPAFESQDAWRDALLALPLGTMVDRPHLRAMADGGDVALDLYDSVVGPVLEILESDPGSLADHHAVLSRAGIDGETAVDAARLLLAGGQAVPVLGAAPEPLPAAPRPEPFRWTLPFNQAALTRLAFRAERVPLISAASGSAIELAGVDALLLYAWSEVGRAKAVQHTLTLLQAREQDLVKDGRTLRGEDARAWLRARRDGPVAALLPKLVQWGMITR